MQRRSRIESFSQGTCYMHYIACTAMMLTCQLLLVCTVLVTNPNENMDESSFPSFGLGSEQLIDKMIAEKKILLRNSAQNFNPLSHTISNSISQMTSCSLSHFLAKRS